MKETTAKKPEGLVGFFGHTYIDREGGGRAIQFQFEIIRPMPLDRYVIQYFSWVDGDPTNCGVMSEAELLGPNVELYATHGDWTRAYEKAVRREGRRVFG